MPFDIVAVGHLINETIVGPGGETRSVLGSPPAYSMAVAARVGARVGIQSAIGFDYPDTLLEPLRQCGVDLQGVARGEHASTNNELRYASDGTKTIKYLSRAPQIEAEDLPPAYDSPRMFYVCPMDWDVSVEAVAKYRERCQLLACDLGGFGGAHSPPGSEPQMQKDPSSVRRIIAQSAIVKASDEDCRRLTGDEGVDIESFARSWLDWGASIAVLTQGSRGTSLLTAVDKYSVPPLPGKPIDTTGGGDSYMGGFLVEYLRTGDVWRAGVYGATTAMRVIEGTGGVTAARMPTHDDVSERLREAGATIKLAGD